MNIVKCKIADFSIDIETDIKLLNKILKNYLADFENADTKISVTEEDVGLEKRLQEEGIVHQYSTTYKLSAIHRKLGEWLPFNDALVLHSVAIDIEGVGVAFAAHSGTGKSTHMMRWLSYLGDKATVVNGDKPIVRFIDGETYAYGTPWMGKEKLGSNMRTPLKHICFIERSETNYVEKLDKNDALKRIFKQVYMPKEPMAVVNTMQLIDRLLSTCQLWIIHCNMDDNAGEIAYNTIFGE